MVALTLINLGAATLIVQVISGASLTAGWFGVILVVGGVAATLAAIMLWRQYLAEARRG
jgi:hypothetical protein